MLNGKGPLILLCLANQALQVDTLNSRGLTDFEVKSQYNTCQSTEKKKSRAQKEMTVTSLKATGTWSSGYGSEAENKTELSKQKQKNVGIWQSIADLPESEQNLKKFSNCNFHFSALT